MPGLTAEKAVAVAGGFTDRANKRIVRLSRTVNGKLYETTVAGDRADPPRRYGLRAREPVLSACAGNLKITDKIDYLGAARHLIPRGDLRRIEAMAITETTGPFGSKMGRKRPRSCHSQPAARRSTSPPRRSPRRSSTGSSRPAFLSGLARLADFVGLALVSVVIFSTYVDTRDAGEFGYVLASLLLPAATVILIGSVNGYAVGDYRRTIIKISRGAAIWGRVFGCFTLVLFFLKMGEDFSRVWLAAGSSAGLWSCPCSASWSAESWRNGARPASSSAAPFWSAAARRRSS